MSRSRSRSRSHALPADGPALHPIADNMWGRGEPDRPHEPNRTLVWNSTPTLRHIRRVLILVDLQQVRQVMEEHLSDAMTVTRILTKLYPVSRIPKNWPCSPTPDFSTLAISKQPRPEHY